MSSQDNKDLLVRIEALEAQVVSNCKEITKNKNTLAALCKIITEKLDKLVNFFSGILLKKNYWEKIIYIKEDVIMNKFMVQQTLYAVRWQLSTPLLAIVPIIMVHFGLLHYGEWNFWVAAFVANLIGAFIFYWIDKWIFKK
jgi:hypothetical protein